MKLDVIGRNIIANASNRFLIQTIGIAFSSLEYIHYKDIPPGSKYVYVNHQIIDIFSLLQQLPNSLELDELKREMLHLLTTNNLDIFKYNDFHLNIETDCTIDKIYELTNGHIDYQMAANMYKKTFYLAKSKLRKKL